MVGNAHKCVRKQRTLQCQTCTKVYTINVEYLASLPHKNVNCNTAFCRKTRRDIYECERDRSACERILKVSSS